MKKKRNEKEVDILKYNKVKLRNKETNFISFIFVGLFLMMIGYLVYFNFKDAAQIADNPYNQRTFVRDVDVVRGTIYAADGSILAATAVNEDGEETRSYPYNNLFCHVVGLKWSTSSGLEGGAEDELTSAPQSEIDRIRADNSNEKALGNDVTTTLDPKIQQYISDAIGDKQGAGIVIEPSTGKILGMVSKPDYNPNTASTDYVNWLNYDSTHSVLINRATQGLYAPGSTFKVLVALEYMRENPDTYQDFSYVCKGSTFVEGGTEIPCYDGEIHGKENLMSSLANSCNCAFSTIGLTLDKPRFKQFCESFGYNTKLPIGIEASTTSFTMDIGASISEAQETGMGQGKTMVTPLQNLLVTATVANKGVEMKPYLIDKVTDSNGTVISTTAPEVQATPITENEAAEIGKYMRRVITNGTGYSVFSELSYTLAGKTGTAQYGGSGSHAWFVGFAPYENPEVAICIILENDYENSVPAQQAAKKVLDTYFKNKN